MGPKMSFFLLHVLTVAVIMSRASEEADAADASRHGGEDHDNTTYEPTDDMSLPADAKQIRWTTAAYDFIANHSCKDAFFTTDRECKNLQKIPKSSMSVYLAGPSRYGQLRAVLPDGGLHKTGSHDAILALDPYPGANFGHLVVVFYVELGVSQNWCQTEGGNYMGGGECLILALRKRCKNAIERRHRRRNFARRCEINFLPLVFLDTEPTSDVDATDDTDDSAPERHQLLFCRSNIPGYAGCPVLRSTNETSGLFCDPVQENTKRCETTHAVIQTSCRVFEICDQAVLISGGWNRWSHRPYHKNNVGGMYKMLRRHGFNRNNIKIFFANGVPGIDGENTTSTTEDQLVHPAVLKLAMRYHLQKLCLSPHCVDSLVVYLNSPAASDGTSLLWDADRDGQASEGERYTLAELLTDLADCEARQVHIITDQSYSGEVVRAFRRSDKHHNVVVYGSSKDNQYSYGDNFSRAWIHTNHTRTCMKHVFREAKKACVHANPTLHSGSDTSSSTLFGSPCDVIPPFTRKELEDNYLGCQNLPTALWVMKFLDGAPRKSPRLSPIDSSRDYDAEDDDYADYDDDEDYQEYVYSKHAKIGTRENESYDALIGEDEEDVNSAMS